MTVPFGVKIISTNDTIKKLGEPVKD
jgi:hypothetical protein